MDFDNSSIYDILSTILSYLTIIHSFELILLLLSMLIIFKIIFFAASTGLLHIHLIRLVQICGTLYMISVHFRMAMIIGKFLGIENLDVDKLYVLYGTPILTTIGIFGYFQLLRGYFCAAAGVMFFFILCERTLATIMYKTYEKWRNIFVIIIPLIVTLSSMFLFCYLLLIGMPLIYLTAPTFCLGAIAFVLLFGSYSYNLRKYKQSQQLQSYNLSHKFQLSENIRSIGLIWQSIFFLSGYIGFALFLFSISNYIGNDTLQYCCFIVFNCVIDSVVLIFTMALLIKAKWRNVLFNHLRKLISTLKRNSQVEDKSLALQKIKNLQGQRLVLSASEEQDLYFQQLEAAWN